MTARDSVTRIVTRRQMLGLMAAAGAAVVVGCDDDSKTPSGPPTNTLGPEPSATSPAATAATSTPEPSALACTLSPEMTEGPYFVDEMLERADIRSDPSDGSPREGTPLALGMRIYAVEGEACTPLASALVDVWHCDAAGLYSDAAANNTVGQKFLRGYQLTDETGAVQFTTIYPGWYTGRAVHIHFKVRTDPQSEQGYEFTSQLFFDPALTEQVYAQPPYNERGSPDTANAADNIYSGGGDQMLLAVTPQDDGYAGSIDIGVRMS